MESLIKRGVAAGLLPFDFGARRRNRYFRGGWTQGRPRTLNEKIQYKMIYDRRKVVQIYSDKFAVRDYVRSRCPDILLPRLLGAYDNVANVVANIPPGPWVMKANHGAGMVLLCKPGETIAPDVIAKTARKWLATDYALRYWEWQYFRTPRRILFEEYLGTPAEPPADYKLFTIHQQVRLITVDRGRFGQHTRDLFRPDWTYLRIRKGQTPTSAVPPERPPQLEAMIDLAQRLSRGHDFMRVDLYVVNDQIYFGELTHSPAAGSSPFGDPALDAELGAYWTVPDKYVDLPATDETAAVGHARPSPFPS